MTTTLVLSGLKVALVCVLPFLLGVGVVGVFVGFLQAATGVQDQASAQAARLGAAAALSLLASPWILRTLRAFTVGLWRDLGRFLH